MLASGLHMNTRALVHSCTHMYSYTHAPICTCTHMYMYALYTRAHVCTCTLVNLYTHTHTCTFTHTYTGMLTDSQTEKASIEWSEFWVKHKMLNS